MRRNYRAVILSCLVVACGAGRLNAADVELFAGYVAAKMKPDNEAYRGTVSGWNTSLTGYVNRRFGATVDVAGYYGSFNTGEGLAVSTRQYSVMAGPQVRLIRTARIETSVRALFGGAHGYVPGPSYNALDQSTFAALVGSNIDLKISRRVSLRFSPGVYITQYGAGETQKNMRFSIGPVFRFGGES